MKKIALSLSILFLASSVFSQGLIPLKNINGDTLVIDISDIQMAFISGANTRIVMTGRSGDLTVIDDLDRIDTSSCNSFLDVSSQPNGSRILVNKTSVLSIKKDGAGAFITLKGGGIIKTTTLWASVIADADTPVGCGGSGGGGATNLSTGTRTSTTFPINNSNGTGVTIDNATIEGGTNVAGLMTPIEKGQMTQQTIAYSATISTNLNNGNRIYVDMTGDAAIAAPSNSVAGEEITYILTANGANRTATFASVVFKEEDGVTDVGAEVITSGSTKAFTFKVGPTVLHRIGGGSGSGDDISTFTDGTTITPSEKLVSPDSLYTFAQLVTFLKDSIGVASVAYNGSTLTITRKDGTTATTALANVVSGAGAPVGAPGTGQRIYINQTDTTLYVAIGANWALLPSSGGSDGATIETNTVPSGGKAGDMAVHTNLGQFYIHDGIAYNAQGFPDGDFAKTASLTTNADLTPNLSTGLRYTWSINGNYNLQNPTFGSIGRKGVIAVTNTAGTVSTITTVGGNYVDENYATVSTIVIPASATKYLTFRQATDSGGPVVMLENVTIINPTMGGDLSGTASNAQIVANAVGTSEIANDAVTLDKQASGTANRLQVFDASGNPAQGTVTGNATLSAGVLNVTGGISNVDLYEQTLEASVTFQDSLKYEYDAFGELNVFQRIDAERAVRYYVGQASGGDAFRKIKQVEIVKTEKYANADSRTGTWNGYPGTSAWGATGAEIFYEFTGTGCYFNHFEDNRGGIWRFYLEQPLGNVIDSVDIDTYCAGAGCGAGINRQDLLFSGKPEGTYTVHGVNIPLWNPASTGENRGWASGYSTGNVVYRHEYTFVSIEWAEANSFLTETQLTATNSNQEFAFNCSPTDSGFPSQWIPSHGEVTTAFFGDSLKLYVDFIEPAISPTIHSPYRAGKKIVLEQRFLGLHDMQADSLCTASTKTIFDNKEVEFFGNFTWTDTVDVSGYGHMLPVFEDWGDVLQTDQGQFSDLDIISGAQETVTNLSGKVRTFRAYNDAQDYFIAAKILDDNTFRIQDGFQGTQFIDHRTDGITQKFYSQVYSGSVVYPGDTYANHFKIAVGVPATNFSSPLTKAYGDDVSAFTDGTTITPSEKLVSPDSLYTFAQLVDFLKDSIGVASVSYNGSTLTITRKDGTTATTALANVVSGTGAPVGSPGTGQRIYINQTDTTLWVAIGATWALLPTGGTDSNIFSASGTATGSQTWALGSTTQTWNSTGATPLLLADGTNGSLGMGVADDNNTRLTIRGKGTTDATSSLLIEQSDGTDWIQAEDDGTLLIHSATDDFWNGSLLVKENPASGAFGRVAILGHIEIATVTNSFKNGFVCAGSGRTLRLNVSNNNASDYSNIYFNYGSLNRTVSASHTGSIFGGTVGLTNTMTDFVNSHFVSGSQAGTTALNTYTELKIGGSVPGLISTNVAPTKYTGIDIFDISGGGSYTDFNGIIVRPTDSKNGFGVTTPSATLDVVGTFQLVTGNQGTGKILVSDANGNADWQDASLDDVGTFSGTTDGSGDLTVTHALGVTPDAVVVTMEGTTPYITTIHTKGSANFKVRVFDSAGIAQTATSVTVSYRASQ